MKRCPSRSRALGPLFGEAGARAVVARVGESSGRVVDEVGAHSLGDRLLILDDLASDGIVDLEPDALGIT